MGGILTSEEDSHLGVMEAGVSLSLPREGVHGASIFSSFASLISVPFAREHVSICERKFSGGFNLPDHVFSGAWSDKVVDSTHSANRLEILLSDVDPSQAVGEGRPLSSFPGLGFVEKYLLLFSADLVSATSVWSSLDPGGCILTEFALPKSWVPDANLLSLSLVGRKSGSGLQDPVLIGEIHNQERRSQNRRGGLTLCCFPSQNGFYLVCTKKGMQVGGRGTAVAGSSFPIKGSVLVEVVEADFVDADIAGKNRSTDVKIGDAGTPKMGSLWASSAVVTSNAVASFEDAVVDADADVIVGAADIAIYDGARSLRSVSSTTGEDTLAAADLRCLVSGSGKGTLVDQPVCHGQARGRFVQFVGFNARVNRDRGHGMSLGISDSVMRMPWWWWVLLLGPRVLMLGPLAGSLFFTKSGFQSTAGFPGLISRCLC